MKKTFGELVRELRIGKGLEQRELADKVKINREPISSATISRLERNEINVGKETGNKIIDELSPDDATRQRLLKALKGQQSKNKPSYEMGEILDEIMTQGGISNNDLDEFFKSIDEKKSQPVLSYWRAGTRLPSGETLLKIIGFLRTRNAPEDDLLRLKAAHLYDLLREDSRISYLSDAERKEIAVHARDMILAPLRKL